MAAQLDIEFPKEVRVPEADTVAGRILRYLQSGGTLTPLEALRLFDCLSLSQRCGELKRQGWPIISELVKVGSGKKVARYSMARAA